MDLRDLAFWLKAARVRSLRKRAEALNAGAIPLMKPEAVRSELESVRVEIYEMEHEDEITEQERKYEERKARGLLRPQKKKKEVTDG